MIDKVATTMTVREMGQLLGLKKTESYYLLHKHNFKTVVIAKQLRVVRESFEEWYAHQDKYRKIDGAPPGTILRENLYSIQDIANMLGIAKDTARDLVHHHKLLVVTVDGKFWIPRVIFDDWYSSQSWYRNADDREKDRLAEEASMTVPDMGRLLGLDRREAWKLIYRERDKLELIRIANKPRITKESFQRWYGSQNEYHLVPQGTFTKRSPVREFVTAQEAAAMLGIDAQKIYRLLQNHELYGRKAGRTWLVRYDDIMRGFVTGG